MLALREAFHASTCLQLNPACLAEAGAYPLARHARMVARYALAW